MHDLPWRIILGWSRKYAAADAALASAATVNRMLADLRFVLGAILAVMLLAVTGLGMVTSVALMREAHMRPIEDARSLAYAGPAGRNAFYDPDGAWRAARDSAPATPLETPATAAPAAAPEQTASVPAAPPPAEAAPVIADRNEPPQATEILPTPLSSTPMPVEEAAPPDPPPVSEPASVERLASAPATLPAADPPSPVPSAASLEASAASHEAQPPPAVSPAVSSADLPPTPRPRPKPPRRKRIVRAHVPQAPAPSPPNLPFFWAPWPAPGEQPGAPTAANKSGQPAGPSASRSQ
jgi:hypothetical protein